MFYAPAVPFEYEVARRWWTIPVGSQLPLVDGKTLQLVFPGSPGGSYGPDVRDAVLCTAPLLPPSHVASAQSDEGVQRLVGDVEFHIYAGDWWTHGHENDPRYNHVILHVVLIYNDSRPTRRQDGSSIPTCSLNDLSLFSTWTNCFSEDEHHWPCQRLLPQLSHEEIDRLLLQAGLQRFEQKAQAFVVQLRAAVPVGPYHLYDSCLFPSLAEGLAYGRDRELFRALGLRLLDQHTPLPEPLGHTEQPAPLDASRLRALAHMLERWHVPGIWLTLRSILLSASERDVALNIIHSALRTLFCDLGLSLDRSDILLCNVVFPFAAAIALLEQDVPLAERAQQLYLSHPGLSSNRVTRMMCTQIRLNRMPRGSCRQQGLHYVYQQTCHAKLCNLCILGKQDI